TIISHHRSRIPAQASISYHTDEPDSLLVAAHAAPPTRPFANRDAHRHRFSSAGDPGHDRLCLFQRTVASRPTGSHNHHPVAAHTPGPLHTGDIREASVQRPSQQKPPSCRLGRWHKYKRHVSLRRGKLSSPPPSIQSPSLY